MASRAINFRAGVGYVTDQTGEGVNVGNSGFNSASGLTVAWSADMTANARDRNSGFDRRLAGINFQANNGTQRDFTITLPDGAGWYDIGLALGDASNAMPSIRAELFDNTTSFAVITGATAAGEFLDATGVVRSAAAWPGSNVKLLRNMASATLVIRLGTPSAGSGSSPIAHVYTNATTAPNPTTATLTGPTTGTTGSASSNFTVTLDAPATSTVTITPAGTVGTVTFSPSSPTITAGNTSTTFTANADTDGTHSISITTSPTLTYSGSPISYVTSTPAAGDNSAARLSQLSGAFGPLVFGNRR